MKQFPNKEKYLAECLFITKRAFYHQNKKEHGFCQTTTMNLNGHNIKMMKYLKYILAIAFAAFITGIDYAQMPTGKPKTEHLVPAISTDSTASIAQIEKQAFDLVNKHRISMGLPTLISKDYIVLQARKHSSNMATGKTEFGHDGAEQRFKIISKSMKQMDEAGENVFTCTGNYENLAGTVVDGWLHSQGHRENIEGDYNLTGMGVVKAENGDYYFTQIFAKGKE